MPRLFLAFELSEHVKDELVRLQDLIRSAAGEGLRFPLRENLHLTVKFIGAIPDDRVGVLRAALSEMVTGVTPFELKLTHCGVFPPRGAAKVVWAAANEHSELTLCHHCVETTCEKLGFARESRPFSPHITLARVREGSARAARDVRAVSERLAVKHTTFVLSELALFVSTTSNTGSKYDVIERVRISPEIT